MRPWAATIERYVPPYAPCTAGFVRMSSADVHTEAKYHEPDHPEYLEWSIGEEHLFRSTTLALLEDEEIAQQRDQHRHDRQLIEREAPTGQFGRLERPDAVGQNRRPNRNAEHLRRYDGE